MSLALLYTSNGLEHVALSILEQCKNLASKHSLDTFHAMIIRRIAYIDVNFNVNFFLIHNHSKGSVSAFRIQLLFTLLHA